MKNVLKVKGLFGRNTCHVQVGGRLHELAASTDHRPIVVELTLGEGKPLVKAVAKTRWNIEKATAESKKAYAAHIKPALEDMNKNMSKKGGTKEQVEADLHTLVKHMKSSATATIGASRATGRGGKPWWSKALTSAEKNRKKVLKKIKKGDSHFQTLVDLKEAKKQYKKLVATEKRSYIQKSLQEAGKKNTQTYSQKLYEMFSLAGGGQTKVPQELVQKRALLQSKWAQRRGVSCEANTPKSIGDLVSEYTKMVSNGDDLNNCFDNEFKVEVEEAAKAMVVENHEAESPINKKSIRAALRKVKNRIKKASGPDGATYWMMVWAGPPMVETLLSIFARVWELGELPNSFQHANIIYLYKGSGSRQEVSGYRPISLMSCIAKLYSLVWLPSLVGKLAPHMQSSQGAFHEKAGSLEQAWLARELIEEQLLQGEQAHVVLTDMEKCYDTIWRAGLIALLHHYNIRGQMLKNISLWVNETKCTPKWNGIIGPTDLL